MSTLYFLTMSRSWMTCFPEPHWQEDSGVPSTGRIVESKLVASLYAKCKYYIGRIQTECTGPESRCWWVAHEDAGDPSCTFLNLPVPWDVLSRTNGGKCPELTLFLARQNEQFQRNKLKPKDIFRSPLGYINLGKKLVLSKKCLTFQKWCWKCLFLHDFNPKKVTKISQNHKNIFSNFFRIKTEKLKKTNLF